MTSEFLRQRADIIIALDTQTRESANAVIDRMVELLDKPKERDHEIVIETLNYIAERAEEETDDAEFALAQRETIATFFASTWKEITDVPLPARGAVYNLAQSLVLDHCLMQAQLEIIGVRAIEAGEAMAAINRAAAKRLSPAQKKELARSGGIKESIAAASKKKAENKDDAAD